MVNSKALVKYTLEYFIKQRLHIGHRSNKLHKKMNSYVFAFRHNVSILDIEKIWLPLRHSFYNLTYLFYKRNSFFLINTNQNVPSEYFVDNFVKDFDLRFKEDVLPLYINGFVTKKWVGGILSNWNVISKLIKQIKLLKKTNKVLSKRYLKYLSYFKGLQKKSIKPVHPDFVFMLDSNKEALTEIISLKIPFFGLVDTNINPDPYLYHLFGNDDAVESIEFVYDFLKDALLEGRLQEQKFFYFLILSKLKKNLKK